MRKLFVTMAAGALLGLGGFVSNASANSLTLVATGPVALVVGQTSTFNIVMTLDPINLTSYATAQVDALGAGVLMTTGGNNMTGTGLGTSNYALRTLAFGLLSPQVAPCAGANPVCTYAPGAPSAGNIGGTAGAAATPGTYTIGTYTVEAFSVGTTTVQFRFRAGVNEWLDTSGNNQIAYPTTNTVLFSVIPEPA